MILLLLGRKMNLPELDTTDWLMLWWMGPETAMCRRVAHVAVALSECTPECTHTTYMPLLGVHAIPRHQGCMLTLVIVDLLLSLTSLSVDAMHQMR